MDCFKKKTKCMLSIRWHIQPQHLIALCDSSSIAHKAFGSPDENTVLVLDGEGKVNAITHTNKLADHYSRIEQLSAKALESSIPGYSGVYELDD